MRTSILILCVFSVLTARSQRNMKPKMAPIYAKGYYVNFKNDTVKGHVQTNPEDATSFYGSFYFKAKGQTKPKLINAQKARAYGFDGQEFVQTEIDGEKRFYKRLVSGRLKLYDYKFHGKIDGYEAVATDYFIRDSRAQGDNPELTLPKKISTKFYKKTLKPYMSDQLMIWTDLDKYHFDPVKIEQAVKEFNRFYSSAGN